MNVPDLLARALRLCSFRETERVSLQLDRVEVVGSSWIPAFSFSVRALRAERKAVISFHTIGAASLRANDCAVGNACSVGD